MGWKAITPAQVVAVLNECLRLDPDAVNAVFAHRVPCNDKLADHPTVQVRDYKIEGGDKTPNVGMLGLLNGLFGVDGLGYGPIVARVDVEGTGTIQGFLVANAVNKGGV